MSDLAAAQLTALAAASDGAIELIDQSRGSRATTFTVSLDTHGIETSNGQIRIRARERFEFVVPDTFPYKPPIVRVPHTRWAGTPHVQWSSQLCIYAAPSVEWNPADGMRGLIARLMLWLQRAAEGTLDPDGQPLHPPVAYSTYDNGWIVIHPDLGARVPWAAGGSERTSTLYAWCGRHGKRIDVVEWLTLGQVRDRVLADELEAVDASGRPYFVTPAFLISDELGFEYPAKAAALAEHLDGAGISREELLHAITIAALITAHVANRAGSDHKAPAALILGTPARRVEGTGRLAHLVAWKFDELGTNITELLGDVELLSSEPLKGKVVDLATSWLSFAKAMWMVVFEDRPEVTRRRDTDTAATWLHGRRVLVLGCGALGAPIAEHCVRAGVSALTVADKSAVSPGILVRQPYTDADIGYAKSFVLANRLSEIRDDLSVQYTNDDVVTTYLSGEADLPPFDLVVDATADGGVRAALEHVRARQRNGWPPVVTALFGHDANRGLVTVAMPGATGAGHDILRRTAVEILGSAAGAWSDVAEDFFPDPPRTEMFFPEPGCSAPTFIGSSAQVVALASMLFVEALTILADHRDGSDRRPMTASVIRLPSVATGRNTVDRLTWSDDQIVTEVEDGVEVRISQRALAEMRAEVRRGARLRGDHIETGGMLLGFFDDATGTLSIDVATGPTPDSRLSALHFDHGTEGSQAIIDLHRAATTNRVGFAGMWHTHPFGPACPSATDEAGMASLVAPDGTGRRALMLILGGDEPTWLEWRDRGTPPTIYARIVHRRLVGDGPAAVPPIPPAAHYFPGGYGMPAPDPSHRVLYRLLGRRR
ncbi:ThiF family adenylyltransferase [Rhodococcus oxybenzonivorans]|uniref:ThiF family adenylyltransferase n=1 Tax=Rhodococcus oxybenzonivorans TaxID=1990687 RepID=UPI00295402D1|nr:ThiF family adenylyltransferase [Rhodococcus oxybenzonivorans]MDV7357679.1 ThiF family adenylyltransferase [Rhodococcus oxybenzonivorans]